ncbi:hypothetical protein CFP56_041893 [Quercus suber]|uniref:Uncharacterized protein n=1 Tax=Quercus suber TaxID=58331 RepID=A0AAW0LJ12_QUESU
MEPTQQNQSKGDSGTLGEELRPSLAVPYGVPLATQQTYHQEAAKKSLLKTNFDGAVFEDLGVAGISVMVQNSFGKVLAALSKIIPLPSSIVALETIAA